MVQPSPCLHFITFFFFFFFKEWEVGNLLLVSFPLNWWSQLTSAAGITSSWGCPATSPGHRKPAPPEGPTSLCVALQLEANINLEFRVGENNL